MAAEDGKRRGLGRGLAALIGDETPAGAASGPAATISPNTVPIEFLRANPYQPRRDFTEEDLADLTQSVKEKGILQPIVVRPVSGATNAFEIVAGERRWRAAQAAKLDRVPVTVRDLTDAETLEIAIIENVQRADLNAIEEADGYQRLMDEFKYTQADVSKLIGKSRSHVANTLRLLGLPKKVRGFVAAGDLTAGHARAIMGHEDAVALARKIIDEGLSVREAEALGKTGLEEKPSGKAKGGKVTALEKDADTRSLERNITDALGLAVSIEHKGDKGGKLVVTYKTLDQLDEICRRLANGKI
ncbi:ParB/RepB/Spo0J family partition protein [Pyruvatibacter mobilis]|jgi:ParB family chromosome partitioning protein|uniref:ParB/RepB/Spo0J family partition protein n=1 Tax=Pyruvatibacter mobilis TaxID=1712261 RepID=UPI003BABEF6C